jgi:hypothetical protein
MSQLFWKRNTAWGVSIVGTTLLYTSAEREGAAIPDVVTEKSK